MKLVVVVNEEESVLNEEESESFMLDVEDGETTIEEVKALIEVTCSNSILLNDQIILYNGKELGSNEMTLNQYNIQDGDLILVNRKKSRDNVSPPQQLNTIPASSISQQNSMNQNLGANYQNQLNNFFSTNSHAHMTPTPNSTPIPTTGNLMYSNPSQNRPSGSTSPYGVQTIDPKAFREYIMSSPDFIERLLQVNPSLADAVLNGEMDKIQTIMQHQSTVRQQSEARRNQLLARLRNNPFDPEAQKAIEEEIRIQNVEQNMQNAIEFNPEAFARVNMLFVEVFINGHLIKAFVDTGAQQSIMSIQCAERVGVMRLVDKRFVGVAKGVGTAKIIGRIHVADMKLGSSFFPCSLTIIEGQDIEFLLGLDMLRRHQCNIDLKVGALKIGDEELPFLAEKDIPQQMKDFALTTTNNVSDKVDQPDEDSINRIVELGVPRDEAIELIRRCGNDVNLAANSLLNQ